MVVLKIIVAILLAALGICLLAFAAFGVYAIKYAIEQRKKEKEAEHRRQTEEERLARRTPQEKARDEEIVKKYREELEERIKIEKILNPDGIYSDPPAPNETLNGYL